MLGTVAGVRVSRTLGCGACGALTGGGVDGAAAGGITLGDGIVSGVVS